MSRPKHYKYMLSVDARNECRAQQFQICRYNSLFHACGAATEKSCPRHVEVVTSARYRLATDVCTYSIVLCLSFCVSCLINRETYKNSRTDGDDIYGTDLSGSPRDRVLDGVHTGATCRIIIIIITQFLTRHMSVKGLATIKPFHF